MEKKDKYIISIITLSTLLVISIMIIIIGVRIIDDLSSMIEMHKNTISVCNMDLKQVQDENEELRKRLEE